MTFTHFATVFQHQIKINQTHQ